MASAAAHTPSYDVHCETKMFEEEYFCTWTIKNLNFFIEGESFKYCITSPQFPKNESTYKWCMFLYPCGYRFAKDMACVGVRLVSNLTAKIKIKCDISLLNNEGCQLEKVVLKDTFNPKGDTEVIMTDINRKPLSEEIIEKDDILIIKAKITTAVGMSQECLEKNRCSNKPRLELELVEDLSVLFLQKKMTDIVVVARGTEFRAHRIILSARSPVLAAMLKYETKEKQERCIEVDDVEPETMQRLLRFIYTSQVEFTDTESAAQLFIAADKYDLQSLKRLCEEYLSCYFTTANVLDILNEADLHSWMELKSQALKFISKNRDSLSGIEKDPSNFLKNPQLLFDILASFITDLKI